MEKKEDKKSRSWAEENGAAIYGLGVLVSLGLLIVFARFCSNS
jgi:hypothetical protein